MEPGDFAEARSPVVFVFNPFTEGYIAQGKAFTPVKHQAMLARDLGNLPQFLCQPDDVVLLAKRPSSGFLNALMQAGFPQPEIVELREGRIDPAGSLCQRTIGSLRPWAWEPDGVELLSCSLAGWPVRLQLHAGISMTTSPASTKKLERGFSKKGPGSLPGTRRGLSPGSRNAEPTWRCGG